MDPEVSSTTARPTARWAKWGKYLFISIILLAIGFVVGCVYTTKADNIKGAHTSHEAQTGPDEVVSIREIDNLRINPNSTCDGTSCSVCKAQFQTTDHIPGEPLGCSDDSRVKNSSCFLCGGECKTLAYLEAHLKDGMRCPRFVDVTCCLLLQMSNATQMCGIRGSYNCYHSDVNAKQKIAPGLPICQCPHGKTGDMCENVHKETFNCKCFKEPYPFCDQEKMVDCNGTNGTDSRCRVEVERSGEKHNCVCDKNTGDADSNDDDCTAPHAEQQTNDSRKLDQCLSLLILMVYGILSLVDKT